ncbi:U-box domain-containing protein 35 [Hordeum vulgare]|nr:U-box domain-containing protein 35 [Hordeum vulgare]
MAGEDGGSPAAAPAPAQVSTDADATAAEERKVMPADEVEYILSVDYSKPLPRRDDDDDHSPYKDDWNDGVDFFNELRRHQAAKQAVLRAEYIANGCIDLADDKVATRSRLSHQVYLDTRPAADDDHGDFIEKLYRGEEDDDE